MRILLILLFCLSAHLSEGQINFNRNLSIPVANGNPLSLAWAGGLNFPLFSEIDLNADGLNDLFVFDRNNSRSLTFVNNGTAGTGCWDYAPQFAERFPAMQQWAFLYDYNCDNKPDIFCNNFRNNGISQYRNDSQGANLTFTLVDSTIDYEYGGPTPANIIASGYLMPNFNDIDGDGDMDILGQQFQCVGGFAYYKNMSMENFGNCDSLDAYVLQTYLWGNFRLRSGQFNNVVVGSWNVSCFSSPFENGGYELAEQDDTYASIYTIDIDGDGDKDALIGDSQADNSLLVINGGSAASANGVSQDTLFPSYDVPVKIHSFPAHAYVDADNDGVKDLIMSQSEYENKNGIHFYKNTGTNAIPDFTLIEKNFLQKNMIDVGESATPVFFDYDSDGLKDLIIGNRKVTTSDTTFVTGLTAYRNNGTATAPSFEFVTDDYTGIYSLQLTGQIYPTFGDLDGDNDKDLLLGLDDGKLIYFTNTASAGSPAVFSNPVTGYMLIDVGQSNTPQLADLNRDGKLDIISGGKNGLIKYFENTGTANSPFFSNTATDDTLGQINVQTDLSPDGYSVPYLFEFGNDYKLIVSCMKGDIYLYENIDGNLNGTFSVIDTLISKTEGSRYGNNLSVSGDDINGDGQTDLLIGFYGGGLQIWNQGPPNDIGIINDENLFSVYPNPATDKIFIHSNGPVNISNIILYDITGKAILRRRLKTNDSFFDIHGIAPGIYTLNICAGDLSVNKKIIIR
jgi:hypothetical protein